MFKGKLEDLGNIQQLNKSHVKLLKSTLLEQFPEIENILDTLLPKKGNIQAIRLKDSKMNLIFVDSVICFFENYKDNIVLPALQIVHMYPHFMQKVQIDKGGISRMISGADVMCPGLTSTGGYIPEVSKNQFIAIYGEGKQHAIAIGKMLMDP